MGTMSLTANLIKAGLGLTATRGLHRATYASRQRSLYTFHQWLHVQGETLCPFHRQLMGYSVTHQRFYSSVAVPHDVTRNHNGQKNVDLPTNDSRDGQFIPDRTIGLTKAEQRKLLRRPPEHLEESRVLKVAIIGAPNAGKSTLANMLMGWRFASVSKKVHTTRHRAIGVLTEGDTQIVFLDTPGMISPGKRRRHRLEMSLLTDPHSVLYDADLVAVIVDVSNIWHRTKIDEEVLKALHLHRAKPSILVLNKIDQLKNKQELLNITRILTEGIVGGHRNWSTVKPTKKTVDIDSLFEKMDSEKVNCKFQEPHDSNSSLNGNSSDSDNQPDHDLLSKGHGDVLSSRDLENDLDTMMTSNGREMAESALEMLEIANTVEEAVEESSEMNKKTYVGEIATGDGTMIEVHGTSEEELNKFLAGEKINVGDRDENPDAVVRTELLSETPTRGQQQQPDLRDGEVWRKYYRRIQEAETQVGDKRGWGNFDAVFMLSALEGDGVIDLKNYLLESAVSGPWQFHSSLVTDQDPIEIARMCVWEKMLDHLPEEIPYQIKIKSLPKSPADCVSLNHRFQNPEEGPAIATRFCMDMSCRQRLALWEIDEDHMLRATFELLCDTQRHMFAALGKGGQTAKLIAVEAKQDLMNTFRRELSLRLVVRCKITTR